MKTLLLIILVARGPISSETPIYAVQYSTEAACQRAASSYPTKGMKFHKAVCVVNLQAPAK